MKLDNIYPGDLILVSRKFHAFPGPGKYSIAYVLAVGKKHIDLWVRVRGQYWAATVSHQKVNEIRAGFMLLKDRARRFCIRKLDRFSKLSNQIKSIFVMGVVMCWRPGRTGRMSCWKENEPSVWADTLGPVTKEQILSSGFIGSLWGSSIVTSLGEDGWPDPFKQKQNQPVEEGGKEWCKVGKIRVSKYIVAKHLDAYKVQQM